MRGVPARRASLPAVLVCAALAGCGCGGASAGTAADDAAAGQHAPLVVLRPLRQEAVPARMRGKHVELRLAVSGLASPGARVIVYGVGCIGPCSVGASADDSGAWSTAVPLSLHGDAVIASVTAAYEVSRGGDVPTRVSVPLDLRREEAVRRARVRAPAAHAPAGGTLEAENEGPTGAVPGPASSLPAIPGGPRAMVLIGDSLSVAQEPLLETALPGWSITTSARVGRPLAEGMGILVATDVAAGSVLAMGLFTNDDPGHLSELQAAVLESLRRVGASGCAIWATIASPPRGGRTFDAANRLLNELATREPRLRVVPWAEATSQDPSLLSGDGVHPGPVGAQLRAALFAQAARTC
jgi:hypothetical protein